MDNIIIIENKRFCPYCGHEITPTPEGQYVCYCEDAAKARTIEREAMQLEWSALILRNSKPQPHFHAQTVCAPIPNTESEHKHYERKSSNDVWNCVEKCVTKYPEE